MKKYAFLITDDDGQWMLTSRGGKLCVQDQPQDQYKLAVPPVIIVSEHVETVPLVEAWSVPRNTDTKPKE